MEETGIKKSGQCLNAVDDAVWEKTNKQTVGRHDSKTVRFLSQRDAVLEVPSAASARDVATATLKQQLQCIQCIKLRICECVHRNTICCLDRKRTQCCSSL